MDMYNGFDGWAAASKDPLAAEEYNGMLVNDAVHSLLPDRLDPICDVRRGPQTASVDVLLVEVPAIQRPAAVQSPCSVHPRLLSTSMAIAAVALPGGC